MLPVYPACTAYTPFYRRAYPLVLPITLWVCRRAQLISIRLIGA
jgi:hypothetical protein